MRGAARLAAAAVLLPVVLLAAACSGPADGAPAPTSTAPSTGAGPAPEGDDLPAGWTRREVRGVSVAVPAGFAALPAGRGVAGASATWALDADDPLTASLSVFVDEEPVGSVALRTRLLVAARDDQLGTRPSAGPSPLEVPGAVDASVVAYEYDRLPAADPAGPVDLGAPRTMVEVTVGHDVDPQYTVHLEGPREVVDDALVGAVLSSVAVAGADEQDPP